MSVGAANEDELRWLSAVAAADLIRRRRLSVTEYVSATLNRIAAENPILNAFLDIFRAQALQAAGRADRRGARGQTGPLHGLPFAVKDLFAVRGSPTTAHSAASSPAAATRTSTAVARLRRGGGVLIGKLALEEFGIGSARDVAPWPAARNPWDLERNVGGSSSGCGSALAAGLVPLALGTDTGGSVRNPAALCGVVGLKPTAGRLSVQGVVSLAPSLDHVGPMARTVADCALLFGVLRTSAPTAGTPLDRGGRPLRGRTMATIGDDVPEIGDEVRQALARAAAGLAELGAQSVRSPELDVAALRRAGSTILHYEAYRRHRAGLAERGALYGESCRRELEQGSTVSAAAYRAARTAQRLASGTMDTFFHTTDLLIAPVVVEPAQRLDDPEALARSSDGAFRMIFNLTGHPAISLPVGLSRGGLPLGVQLVAGRGRDEFLLAAAEALERALAAPLRPPHPPRRADVRPDLQDSRS